MRHSIGVLTVALFCTMLVPAARAQEPAATGPADTSTAVVDLDFSTAATGILYNEADPAQAPALVATHSAYGRLRGQSAIPRRDIRYAGAALGRDGNLSALRTGTSGEELNGIGHIFRTSDPFTIETWVYVYDAAQYFHGPIMGIAPGPAYGHGMFVVFQKAKWSLNGWVELRWGLGKKSEAFWHKGFAPETWHHIAIAYDGSHLFYYIDGTLSTKVDAIIDLPPEGSRLEVGSTAHRIFPQQIPPLDFKFDALRIYPSVLNAQQIASVYATGASKNPMRPSEEHALEDALSALKLGLPAETSGYFYVGQPIPVQFDMTPLADELVVNDKHYVLSTLAAAPAEQQPQLAFTSSGIYPVHLELRKEGNIIKQADLPVAVVPFAVTSSKLGASEIAETQPELASLGMRLSRVVVEWNRIEPAKQEYDWARLDAVMKRNHTLGIETLLCFTGRPRWMKCMPGSENLPEDMDAYRNVWRILANRYDGVQLFEVWNGVNPSNSLRGSTTQKLQDYIVLLQAASDVLRTEVPQAKILAGRIDITDGIDIAAALLQQAPQAYDIVSARNYADDPLASGADDVDPGTEWSRKILAAAGGKPVWNTAGGIRQVPRPTMLPTTETTGEPVMKKSWPTVMVDEQTAARWVIRDLALELSAGIGRVILKEGPSVFDNGDCAATGLPSPEGQALAVFNSLVSDSTTLMRLHELTGGSGIAVIRFETPGGVSGVIMFSLRGEQTIQLEESSYACRVLDLFGNMITIPKTPDNTFTLTEQPVYFLETNSATVTPIGE